MAELTFVGAAGTVTGSKHLITYNGHHVFIDCGLFQGPKDVVVLNSVPLPVAARDIEAVVITHGHIDHVGYLPKLVHDGFRGAVYCTPPTQELIRIVLEDAAGLQTRLKARGMHNELYAPPPFYNDDDVQQTMSLIKPVALQTAFDVCGMKATYQNAAHIIGSAFVQMDIDGRRAVFSGDVGRYNRELLFDPSPMSGADVLICESTYGDRVHPPDAVGELETQLAAAVARGGAIVIPAFAVERAQELLLAIGEIQRRGSLLANVPVYLDSPMAAKVDDLFERFPDAHKPIPHDGNRTPFGCENVTIAIDTDASKAINRVQGPHIIISASGMAAGGRVLHHIYNHISDPKSTMLFVGYQSLGTLGFFLANGAKTIKIFGDTLPVHATIDEIGGFSAHADQNEIQHWFDTCTGKPEFYAVHGEPQSAQALCDIVKTKYGWNSTVAHRGTTVTI